MFPAVYEGKGGFHGGSKEGGQNIRYFQGLHRPVSSCTAAASPESRLALGLNFPSFLLLPLCAAATLSLKPVAYQPF